MFNDPQRNPRKAQLMFNTHDTNIWNTGLAQRPSLVHREGPKWATNLYPLSDYKPRKEENIKRGYLQGRYGGVPFIHTPNLLSKDTNRES